VHLSAYTKPETFNQLEDEVLEFTKQKEQAVKNQEFERAAQLRDTIKLKREELDNLKKQWEEKRNTEKIELKEDDIAAVISKITGIPLFKLEEKESKKLLRMEDEISKNIVGQMEAIAKIARAIRRARAGLKGAVAIPVRGCRIAGADRYVGIYGKVRRLTTDRSPSRVCGV
jgi:ATP-dependent Clp protease ATP-binding subunit ClpC